MNKYGEIIFVEDDADDRELLDLAIKDIGISNKITFLQNGAEAFDYFNNTDKDPFLIISDINMPVMNGMELRDKMQLSGEIKLRTVPFLFMTTGAARDNIINAYAHSVQGFFLKPTSFIQLKDTLKTIFSYWEKCTPPTFVNA